MLVSGAPDWEPRDVELLLCSEKDRARPTWLCPRAGCRQVEKVGGGVIENPETEWKSSSWGGAMVAGRRMWPTEVIILGPSLWPELLWKTQNMATVLPLAEGPGSPVV